MCDNSAKTTERNERGAFDAWFAALWSATRQCVSPELVSKSKHSNTASVNNGAVNISCQSLVFLSVASFLSIARSSK